MVVKAPTPMGKQEEMDGELLGSDPCFPGCCPRQRFLAEGLLPFPVLTPLVLLRVPLGISPRSQHRHLREPEGRRALEGRCTWRDGAAAPGSWQALGSLPLARQAFGTNSGPCIVVLTCIKEMCYPSPCPGLGHPCVRSILCKDL